MDTQTIEPKTLDVAHLVDKLSFHFFDETEALRLSVRRITSPHAFDEIGRPLPRGLYDPALGPTSFSDGPCQTCGQSYITCPGHFGHIQLPFAVPNPLLGDLHLKLLRAICVHCNTLRITAFDCDLLLARLYLEDAGHPKCAYAVECYRSLVSRSASSSSVSVGVCEGDTVPSHPLVKDWAHFLSSFPEPLSTALRHVDAKSNVAILRNILHSARKAWQRAYKKGKLLPNRSVGWRSVESFILAPRGKCARCDEASPGIRKGDRGRFFRSLALSRKDKNAEVLVSATDMERQIAALWTSHTELFDMLYGLKGRRPPDPENAHPHRRLFVCVVLVPPSRFRPTSIVGNMSYAAEHAQNHFFQELLVEINVIVAANEQGLDDGTDGGGGGGASDDDETDGEEEERNNDTAAKSIVVRPTKARFALAMVNLQQALHSLYDSSSSTPSSRVQSTGIRQQLEAKEGLFRQHMMGKRVNFSARSVIGPDVFLDTDEVGIPESFAKLLSIPEPVTPANLEEMRRAVLNGPSVYPGALGVEDYAINGEPRVIRFRPGQTSQSFLQAQAGLLLQNRAPQTNGSVEPELMGDATEIDNTSNATMRATPKRVLRHLKTGDVVLFNRQPTLHRVSIMAHRVRVLPGDRTIRFHYANCGSYNADFDGDEMNVHVPQDYISRTEAEELMLSSKHYIVPTSGAPVRGLIQDHVAAATLLSRRDTFLDREGFMQLLFSATEKLMARPDRVDKGYVLPMPAILKPIPMWTGKQLISAVLFVVRNGRPGLFLEGKAKTSPKVVGAEEAHVIIRRGELLQGVIDKASIGSSMYGLVHAVQESYGCVASDDFLSSLGRLCLFFMRVHGHTTGVNDLTLLEEGDRKRSNIISESIHEIGISVANKVYAQMNRAESSEVSSAKTYSQARRFIEEMVRRDGAEAEDRLDGAMKDALNNVSTAVMKACVPASLSRQFPDNGFALMTNTGAKGSAVNAAQISCLLGSTVLEGKRVPRMGGSGATLPCFVPYDPSPLAGGFIASRFLTGITPQEFFFHAMSGREGLLDTSLKTANSGYLQRCLVKHLEGVRVHYDGSVRDSDGSVLQFIYGDDGIDPSKSRWLTDKIDWQVRNMKCLQRSISDSDSLVKHVRQARRDAALEGKPISGTLLEEVSPSPLSRCGAVSDRFEQSIEKALEKEGTRNDELRSFLESRYQLGAVDPGEAVGVTAAQGIGEPSTQLTLNTFHHAGSSSAHVTLGIPRLRELLMTASKEPKTPSMTLPILKEMGKKGADLLWQRLQHVAVLDLLLGVEVHEQPVRLNANGGEMAIHTMTIVLRFPEEHVYQDIGISFARLQGFVKSKMIESINLVIRKEVKRMVREGSRISSRVLRDYLSETKSTLLSFQNVKNEPEGEDLYDEEIDDTLDMDEDGDWNEESSDSDASHIDEERKEPMPDAFEGDIAEDLENDSHENTSQPPIKKVKRKRRRDRASRKIATPSESKYGTERLDYIGFQRSSFSTRSDKEIVFDWSLPMDLCGKMSMSSTVRTAAEMTKLTEVAGISRSFVKSERGEHMVITEGSNLTAMMLLGEGLVDLNGMMTNNMHAILNTYGVEAMRIALIQELHAVFDAYGIPVDIRHLQLIADYATAHGTYRAFNRIYMRDAPSPLQRMTFETSVKFLTSDTIHGSVEEMTNPSAALALGQLTEAGTGGFQLLQRVN